MSKRQKSFFERLTELNDRHDEKHDKTTTNKAKRSKVTIAVASVIAVGIVAAIAIPLTINVTKVNYKNPLPGNTQLIDIESPDGKKLSSTTVQQVEDIVNSKDVEVTKEINDLYHKSVEFLYQQEYEASLEFQRIWNASLLKGESVNNSIALKSLVEIKKDVKGKLEDIKLNLKKNYGYQNWEKQFNEMLAKPEYGKSTSEKEAVTYLVFKEIESEALRRYQLEYKKQSLDYINRTANTDIYKFDSEGNQIKGPDGKPVILFKKGEKVFPYFQENVNYFVDPNDPTKVATLLTKSYVTDLKNPTPFIEKYFNTNKVTLPTVYKLAGKTNPSDIYQPWILSDDKQKALLSALLKYSVVTKDDKFEVVSNMNRFLGFGTAKDYAIQPKGENQNTFENKKSAYQDLLGAFTATDGSTLGTSGITTVEDLLNTSVPQGLAVFAKDILGNGNENNIPEISLGTLAEINEQNGFAPAIVAAFNKVLPAAQAAQSEDEAIAKINEFNRIIDSVVENIKTSDMTQFFNKFYNWNFAIQTQADNQASALIPTVMRVKDMQNAYLIYTDSEVLLARYDAINSLDDFKAFITLDAQNYAAGNKTYFNVTNKLSGKINPEDVISSLTSNPKFLEFIKTQPNANAENNANYTDEAITSIQNKINSIVSGYETGKVLSLVTKVKEWVQKQNALGTSYNFEVVDGKIKLVYSYAGEKQVSEKSAEDTMFEYLMKNLWPSKGEK
ncbi:HinT-interacting membrane complex protein P80 [Mycoplasma seminis]|uniref:Membrane protein P80 n=1 Tax=Mycoplasma seminis TaxID=512749 RepID=A0ABY9HAF6_9MOLU|nr:hypothetical protein [Mycoplasma seminis]WLP85564.1 hypothetical protein Q8852_00090 [Mycoplasma seminis]